MMENISKKMELQLKLRPRSPDIISGKTKMKMRQIGSKSFQEFCKNNPEYSDVSDKNTIIYPLKTVNNCNNCSLQSTPYSQYSKKLLLQSKEEINLSPISVTPIYKKLSNINDNLDDFPTTKSNISQGHSFNSNILSVSKKYKNNKNSGEYSLLKNNNQYEAIQSKLLNNNISKNYDETKKCLLEKNTSGSTNVDMDQDSLNISFDTLEQVCQMTENNFKNKNSVSLFLYGDNLSKIENTIEEKKLLQLALNMEDNLSMQLKKKKVRNTEKKFTSLNELNKSDNLFKSNDQVQSVTNNYAEDILNIGNTQMCEIADITEPLSSFYDQLTQNFVQKSNDNKSEHLDDIFNTNINNQQGYIMSQLKNDNQKQNCINKKNFINKTSIENQSIMEPQNNSLNSNDSKSEFKGFSTATGKSIKVSEKALQNAQKMLIDDETESTMKIPNNSLNSNEDSRSEFRGFSTATSKSIKVSEKALQNAQKMLIDDETETTMKIPNNSLNSNEDSRSEFKGFSTATGKSIKVSEKALQNAQKMLIDDETESTMKIPNNSLNSNEYSRSEFRGFSTATGKSIKVSEKALQNVHKILNDDQSSVHHFFEINKDSKFTINHDNNVLQTFSILDGLNTEAMNDIFADDISFSSNLVESLKSSSVNSYDCKVQIEVPGSFNNIHRDILNDSTSILEDQSLIDTIEQIEKVQNVSNLKFNNKRPLNPTTNDIQHENKKTLFDNEWEIKELENIFKKYLNNKLSDFKVSLFSAVGHNLPKRKVIKQNLNYINMDNLLNMKLYWDCNQNLKDANIYNFCDVRKIFESHSFVDKKLIPKGWVENHFFWIVWKLESTELSFPNKFSNKLLTAKNIILQLLFRYYREIEKCQRSALKKILEKDDISTKRMVLCVSKITYISTSETFNIELTDGWYKVYGMLDFEMNRLIRKGVIKVGTKLFITNAELIGAGEGIDPLEIHENVKLKISTNSTRRARWYSRLGFCKNSNLPLPITLESILPRGGLIGSLSLLIIRKYPMLYFERKSNSKSIFRNEKMERLEEENYKITQQKNLEKISSIVRTELEAELILKTENKIKSRILTKDNIDNFSLEELSCIIENSMDPSEIQSIMSKEKLEAVKYYKKSQQDNFIQELKSRVNKVYSEKFENSSRKVIPLLKLRVVEVIHSSTGFNSAILTIWNPSEDIITFFDQISEGQCCVFNYITVTGFINGELQLSAGKQSTYITRKKLDVFAKRKVVSTKDIWSDHFTSFFGEVDIVSIVIKVNKTSIFEEVYVSDTEMNVISIIFQNSIKEFCCNEMLIPGTVLCGINLLLKNKEKKTFLPKLWVSELSSFSTLPKAEYLRIRVQEYKIFMNNHENLDFLQVCQGKVNTYLLNNDNTILNMSKNKIETHCREVSSSIVNTSLNNFQSEFSPARKRIKMLNAYGKTPPLNIVHTKPINKKLTSQFKTPSRI
ncbi:breast cancer type 2 susceptibility protein-like isoform X2 [Daktulosphaira vitifoliae]|uniref:breast cancer type 2 susceptibility protein-like isoform X2 n=1 Tax=Daktulosphaira vitifoliae TaxID=58002 RepID=UPI0021AA8AE5|nr:breast cancer type 2 susceptibility protein-like isoform X2 [Daktulosphaira vitifoliae]